MIYKLILFLLSVSSVFAIEINYNSSTYENFEIQYYIDKDNSMRLVEIKDVAFSPISSVNAFNGKVGILWYKIELINKTKLNKKLYLHNDLAYFSKAITIYEIKNNSLKNQFFYNIMDCKESNKLVGSTLIHPIDIKSNSSLTLYVKNEAMVSSIVDFNIYDKKNSMDSLTNKTFLSNIIIAILISLAAYNLMFYFFNRRKEFLYYSIYLINASLGLMYMYGTIFNNFHLYGKLTYYFNITMILVPLFLVLFLKTTFDINKLNSTLNKFFTTVIGIAIITIFIALFVDLILAVEIGKINFIYSFVVVIYFSFFLFKIEHHMKKVFLIAYFTYVIGMLISILAISGVIPINFFTFHASGIALVFEAILFSYMINNHIRNLELEIIKQKEIIVSKNKKAQLGEMINAITHQWKQPISAISSVSTLLEFKLLNKKELTSDELKEKVAQINKNIVFLDETIDDFKDFFNPNKTLKEHDIKKIIDRAISLSQDDTLIKGIIIDTDIKYSKKIFVYKNELLHIILNIIQNSKEAFKRSDEDIKLIKILGYEIEDKVYIDIIDNAGGISQDTLPHIFNEYYTTKQHKSGSGLGLYLSKFILEDHLKGTIEVKNIQGGAMFRIIL